MMRTLGARPWQIINVSKPERPQSDFSPPIKADIKTIPTRGYLVEVAADQTLLADGSWARRWTLLPPLVVIISAVVAVDMIMDQIYDRDVLFARTVEKLIEAAMNYPEPLTPEQLQIAEGIYYRTTNIPHHLSIYQAAMALANMIRPHAGFVYPHQMVILYADQVAYHAVHAFAGMFPRIYQTINLAMDVRDKVQEVINLWWAEVLETLAWKWGAEEYP